MTVERRVKMWFEPGHRIGELVLLEHRRADNKAKPPLQTRWLCRCDCSREVEIRQDRLLSGAVKTCGHDAEAKRVAYSRTLFRRKA